MIQTLVQNLQEEIQSCEKCSLCLERRKKAILGEGDVPCNVLFLGEGPGEDEDATGTPFVDRGGKLLRQTIISSGLHNRKVKYFLTYLVRCRLPGSRDPTPMEAEACWYWTREVLKITKPRVIVTLGRVSLAYLAKRCGVQKMVGSHKITDLVGKAIHVPKWDLQIFPSFHPTHVSRNNDRLLEVYRSHFQFLAMSLPSWTAPIEPVKPIEPAEQRTSIP